LLELHSAMLYSQTAKRLVGVLDDHALASEGVQRMLPSGDDISVLRLSGIPTKKHTKLVDPLHISVKSAENQPSYLLEMGSTLAAAGLVRHARVHLLYPSIVKRPCKTAS
jgi:hypothetical protein